MSEPKNVAAYDFPLSAFPITIKCYSPTGKLVWCETVHSAPAVVRVPGFGPGSVAETIVTLADGTIYREAVSG